MVTGNGAPAIAAVNEFWRQKEMLTAKKRLGLLRWAYQYRSSHVYKK